MDVNAPENRKIFIQDIGLRVPIKFILWELAFATTYKKGSRRDGQRAAMLEVLIKTMAFSHAAPFCSEFKGG